MENFTQSMNITHGETEGAYVIKNVNTGLAAYDTLCLICAELDIDLNDVEDNDFQSASLALEYFCNSCNEDTGFTVSVWFDQNNNEILERVNS